MKRDFEVFMFVDALGWELVNQSGFLADILPERREIEMQFGYSCSAIPTILTGKQPDTHGHLSLFEFAPARSPFKKFKWLAPLMKPASLWNRGRVRHLLSRLVKKLYGFTGYFQLYLVPFEKLGMMDYCEKQDLFVRHGIGGCDNLADMLAKYNIKGHISNWRLSDKQNIEAGKKAVIKGGSFIFVYTAGLDGVLHDHVENPHAVQIKLDWYSKEITDLLDTCRRRGGNWRFTIFSDHGMTPLTGTVDIKSAIEKTALIFGKEYGACYDSTLFRPSFITTESEKVIMEAVKPFEQYGHWLTEDEEKHYGIYRADRSFGSRIFLTNPGIQIVPSDMGSKALKGMHGFAPEDKYSRAAILSTHPIPEDIRHVADYFRLMTRSMEEMAK